jgi:hypothetical protein
MGKVIRSFNCGFNNLILKNEINIFYIKIKSLKENKIIYKKISVLTSQFLKLSKEVK